MNEFHRRHRIVVFMQKYAKKKRMRYKRDLLFAEAKMPKCESCKHFISPGSCHKDFQFCVFTESSMYEPS